MNRTIEQRMERLVCAEHCRYYKPWSTPQPDCGAARRVCEQMDASPHLVTALERLRNSRLSPPLRKDALLLRRVCTRCDHYPYNCAYRRPDRTPTGEPCGALLVLDVLLSTNQIRPETLLSPKPHSPRHGE